MRRRILYLGTILILFGLLVGVPLMYKFLTIPETCDDGKQNQGETAPDRGGPCLLLDERFLSPYGVLWARTFKVREGYYNAVAYIENPNEGAGVSEVNYRFRLFDDKNVLVADQSGKTFVMPGGVTPVFSAAIPTGNRAALRAFFNFTSPLSWRKASDTAKAIIISNKKMEDAAGSPRLSADVENTTVAPMRELSFVASIFDPQGNSFASSATVVPYLGPGQKTQIVFTWPHAFPMQVGRIDVIARVPPAFINR